MKIDVTLPVFLDNAEMEYIEKTEEIMNKYGFSLDVAEIALERALYNLKERKIKFYASALYAQAQKEEPKENAL